MNEQISIILTKLHVLIDTAYIHKVITKDQFFSLINQAREIDKQLSRQENVTELVVNKSSPLAVLREAIDQVDEIERITMVIEKKNNDCLMVNSDMTIKDLSFLLSYAQTGLSQEILNHES